MSAAPEDCPCCDGHVSDLDASMVQAFLAGHFAGSHNMPLVGALCERHERLAIEAVRFVNGVSDVLLRAAPEGT